MPGADPGEVKWVNFHPLFLNHADAQTSNTSTRLWFYYIIRKIHPPISKSWIRACMHGIVSQYNMFFLANKMSVNFFFRSCAYKIAHKDFFKIIKSLSYVYETQVERSLCAVLFFKSPPVVECCCFIIKICSEPIVMVITNLTLVAV